MLARLAAALVLVAMFFAIRAALPDGPLQDPDRFFHLAVARAYVDEGLPRTLPQVAGLGWDQAFPDKEFLFHALMGAGWAVKGAAGALLVPALCAALAFAALVVAAARRLHPGVALFVVAVVAFGNPDFLQRLLLVRPHTLAVLAYVVLLGGVLSRRPGIAFAAGLVFALAYHALYMPAAALAVAAALSWRDGEMRKLVALGAGGLALGALLNPYFPSQLAFMFEIVGIATRGASTADLPYGVEIFPLAGDVFLRRFAPFLVVLAAAVAHLARRGPMAADAPRDDVPLLLVVSALFWVLALQSPRAAEYAVPTTCLLAAALGAREGWRAPLLLVVLGAALVLQGPRFISFARSRPATAAVVDGTRQALAQIPPQARGSTTTVLNCEWERGPQILFDRPDLRFVDALDPSLLVKRAPERAALREALLAGRAPDPAAVAAAFDASWVLCQRLAPVEQMEQDPRFVRVFPKDFSATATITTTPFLYRVVADAPLYAPSCVDVTPLAVPELSQASPAAPAAGPTTRVCAPFVDLGAPRGPLSCALVEPVAEAVTAAAGADLIGVGGGRAARLWRNGAPVFTSLTAFPEPRLRAVLVPLDPPLAAGDRVQLVVCSGGASTWHGAALSLWTRAGVVATCAGRPRNAFLDAGAPPWAFASTHQATCLGPIAAPAKDGR